MKRAFLLCLFALVFLTTVPQMVKAEPHTFVFTNSHDFDIYIAVAYVNKDDELVVSGWWTVPSYNQQVIDFEIATPDFYVFGDGGEGNPDFTGEKDNKFDLKLKVANGVFNYSFTKGEKIPNSYTVQFKNYICESDGPTQIQF